MVPGIVAVSGYEVAVPRRAQGGSGIAFDATLRRALSVTTAGAASEADAVTAVRADDREEARRDRAARQDATDLLAELDQLQREVLRNGVPVARLQRMNALAAHMAPEDADLIEICSAIALRARVEAARLHNATTTPCRLPPGARASGI